jgi:hypothetical protein
LELTDGGKAVPVPASSGLQFSTATFPSANPDIVPGGDLYFLRSGAVVDSNDAPLPNLLGQTRWNFTSVTLRSNSAQSLLAAGLTAGGQLLIGDDRRLAPVNLPLPATSKPEWRPYAEDVWLGAGNRGAIYRVPVDGPVGAVSITSQVGSLPPARITAVRFSSDGDRVALVLRGPGGAGTAWVGSVVTSGSDVRVDSLEPLTPPALSVTDVAWADPSRLLLIAAAPGAEPRVWQVYSDGSQLDTMPNIGLPGPPTAVTAAVGEPPVVAAEGSIWLLNEGTWASVSGTSTPTPGTNPVYAP